jgi:hypothetical protein
MDEIDGVNTIHAYYIHSHIHQNHKYIAIHIAFKLIIMKKCITQEQINIILLGIEDGFTIEQCCERLLRMDRNFFYQHATMQQKDEVKTHKLLHSDIHSCYMRSFVSKKK